MAFFMLGFGLYFGGKTSSFGNQDDDVDDAADPSTSPNGDATAGTGIGCAICVCIGLCEFYGCYAAHKEDFITVILTTF